MANSFNVVTDWISDEGLRVLVNKLTIAGGMNTSYNKEFRKPFAVGDSVRIDLPFRPTIRNGMGYAPQALSRQTRTVNIDQVFGVDWQVDDLDAVLRMERKDIKEAYIDPTIAKIAQELDSRAALFAYQNTPNIVGVLGTNPTSFKTIGKARQRMIEMAGWWGKDHTLSIPPSVNTDLVDAASQFFNPPDAISKQYKDGAIGRNNGFDWYESMSLYSHTAGTWAGAVTVSGSGQSGSSLNVTCTTGDTFFVGDVIAIAAVYAVNPETLRVGQTATTKQFVVTQNAVGAASAATLQIWPPIVGPGVGTQNVDALPLTGQALTLFPGTSSPSAKAGMQGLAFTSAAFAMCHVPLELPTAVEHASMQRDPETGIAIRFTQTWDPILARKVTRFDCSPFGFGRLYADECSVRLLCS